MTTPTFDSSSPRVNPRCKEMLARLKAAGHDKAGTVYRLSQSDFPESELNYLLQNAVMPFGSRPAGLVNQVLVDLRGNSGDVALKLNYDIV